ncbi:MAG: uroporphyrinogen decarboxylase family protein [Kiritimatiellae bacterium]|nr:uroporphyrinogen decarboxylase family protein [Kiritimatiellia bacterium]
MRFCINTACRNHYSASALDELRESHPYLFPDYCRSSVPPAVPTPPAPSTCVDAWGVTMSSPEEGIAAVSVRHPLADWSALEGYSPPPMPDLTEEEKKRPDLAAENRRQAMAAGDLVYGGLPHGHTFLRLCDLRGYEALICDMADEEPRLWRLIEMIEAHNEATVRCSLRRGAEWMGYAEDLGMQTGPMLSPEHLRKYIKPSYQRLMKPARDAGCVIHMHSDGDIRALADDLVDSGVQVVNLQDLVNGIEWIRRRFKGKVCIDLDIDRQTVTRFGTPAEVDALIQTEVKTLGSREGGLIMVYGMYPGIPLANAKALMDAMEKYSTYYS